jgi:hypothetical protein
MFCSRDVCKHLYSGISSGKEGRGEERLKAEMRIRARLRRSWRGVNNAAAELANGLVYRVLCRKDCVF